MSLCNPAESDEMEPLPVMLVRDLSIYGSAALKITCSTSMKNLSELVCQAHAVRELHNLCNLRNLCNPAESGELKPLPVMRVRDWSSHGSAGLKIPCSSRT